MPAYPRYKRRQYLVDRAYQLRFVTRVFLVVLAIAVISCAITAALLWKTLYVPQESAQTSLITAILAVASTLLVELLVAIPLVFYVGIRQSHRVVGPLSRMTRALQAIGQGNFSQRLTLREGDALLDLGTAINRMAEDLQRRFPRAPAP